jgi:HPt (histidine-containing phosphotransfer) domain-containing protein
MRKASFVMARIIEASPGGSGGAGSDRPIDLVHLARSTFGDKDLEFEVLGLFERQSALLISRIDGASDDKTWRDCAHTLKGSAQGIGAWRVARTAECVEKSQDDRRSRAAVEALDALKSAVAEANATIRGLVARR